MSNHSVLSKAAKQPRDAADDQDRVNALLLKFRQDGLTFNDSCSAIEIGLGMTGPEVDELLFATAWPDYHDKVKQFNEDVW